MARTTSKYRRIVLPTSEMKTLVWLLWFAILICKRYYRPKLKRFQYVFDKVVGQQILDGGYYKEGGNIAYKKQSDNGKG